MAASFNLVEQSWIPVRQNGQLSAISLEDALLRTRELQGIEDPNPLVVAALHRFLLAVLHRALNGPRNLEQAAEWFREGFPAHQVRDYLARYRDRFDLFDPGAPFYQVADFHLEEKQRRSWTVLTPELNSDNNKVLFDHTITATPGRLYPAQAARLLIANQAFALSAGKSLLCHTTTAPIATAATILVQGDSLHETLCLNLPLYKPAADQAAWEIPQLTREYLADCTEARRAPIGIVDRYTWQSRAIRFYPVEHTDKTIIQNISYASGVRCDDPSEIRDPLVAYRRVKDQSRLFPLGFREDRALWRDFHALLPAPDGVEGASILDYAGRLVEELSGEYREPERPVQVVIFGQANNQAKVEFWRMERYHLPATLLGNPDLRNLIETCLSLADETGQRLNSAARALAKRFLSEGKREPLKEDVTRLVNSFPHGAAYWSALEREFAAWLAGLGPDAIKATARYHHSWLTVVDRHARRAWGLTAQAAGTDSRALRAVFASEGVLMAFLAKQRKVAA